MADPSLLILMSDAVTRSMFEVVASNRWLRMGELLDQGSAKSHVSREAAQDSVRKLQDLKLIDVKSSGLEDFNTVFITAAGLEASRKISA
jgi:hypothetical protein